MPLSNLFKLFRCVIELVLKNNEEKATKQIRYDQKQFLDWKITCQLIEYARAWSFFSLIVELVKDYTQYK